MENIRRNPWKAVDMKSKLKVINVLLAAFFLVVLCALMLQFSDLAGGSVPSGVFLMVWVLILIAGIGWFLNIYFYGARTAWRFLRIALPAFCVMVILVLILIALPSRKTAELILSIAMLSVSAMAIGSMVVYIIQAGGSGKPLLVIHRSLSGWLSIVFGIILLVFSIPIIRNEWISSGASVYNFASEIFNIVLIAYIIFTGYIKVYIREKGISLPYGQIPWEIIENYGWEEDHPETLTVRLKKRLWLMKEIQITAPKSQQDKLDEILAAKVILKDGEYEKPCG
jgi:hypothetical protein